MVHILSDVSYPCRYLQHSKDTGSQSYDGAGKAEAQLAACSSVGCNKWLCACAIAVAVAPTCTR